MGSYEALRLGYSFEFAHPPLQDPGRLVRLLCSVISILICYMNDLRHHLALGDSLAPQLVGHDLPGLYPMVTRQLLKEALCSSAITL